MGKGLKQAAFPFTPRDRPWECTEPAQRPKQETDRGAQAAPGGEEHPQLDSILSLPWESNVVHQAGRYGTFSHSQVSWSRLRPGSPASKSLVSDPGPSLRYQHPPPTATCPHWRQNSLNWRIPEEVSRFGFSLRVLTTVQRSEIRVRVRTHRSSRSSQRWVLPPQVKKSLWTVHPRVLRLIHKVSLTPQLQRHLLDPYQLTSITPKELYGAPRERAAVSASRKSSRVKRR